MKTALVLGAGGFIGGHLVRDLKARGYHVDGADIHGGWTHRCDVFWSRDLRDPVAADDILRSRHFDEVYQLAADMGGAGYIFTGDNDAQIMHNSAQINLNVAEACRRYKPGKVLYTSSACIYPEGRQASENASPLVEADAYPANPDSEYGWEKLFSERLWMSYARNHGLDVRIARLHNIFGPGGAWNNGREKAPAALCRKIAECLDGGTIEIWGDGQQTRSFLYVEECLEGFRRLIDSKIGEPVNLGSERMISIDSLALLIAEIAGKDIRLGHIPGPQGVRGRCSDNAGIREKLGWAPAERLEEGLEATYRWIAARVREPVAA